MRLITVYICTFILLFCGCSGDTASTPANNKIIVNYPADDSVNGYRKPDNEIVSAVNDPNYMPDIISGDEIEIVDGTDNEGKNAAYVGNKNSKKFHDATCGSAVNTKEENKVYFDSRQAFIDNGFSPCSRCNP